jgi:hypothetical protein
MDMHSCRWKTDTIRIPVKPKALAALGISGPDSVLNWEVKPDLPVEDQPMLSAILALEIDIIETNQWLRPIYFALCPAAATAGVDSCLESCGLVQRLLPVSAARHGRALDTLTIKRILLDPASYRSFPEVKQHDMPRVSPVLNMYRSGLIELASYYSEKGDQPACKALLDRMDKLLPASVLPLWPDHADAVKQLRRGGKSQ